MVVATNRVGLLAALLAAAHAQCPYSHERGEYFFDTTLGTCQKVWGAGSIATDEAFSYGRFEVRMMAPACSGQIMSFFLFYPNSTHPRHPWQEIDFAVLGKGNNAYGTPEALSSLIIGLGREPENVLGAHLVNETIAAKPADYQRYQIEWTPDRVVWAINNVTVRKLTVEEHPDLVRSLRRPMQLYISLWSPGPNAVEEFGKFDMKCLPSSAFVDYVKVESYDVLAQKFTPKWTEHFDTFTEAWEDGRWIVGDYTISLNRVQFVRKGVNHKLNNHTVTVDGKDVKDGHIEFTMHKRETPEQDQEAQTACFKQGVLYKGESEGGDKPAMTSSAVECHKLCQTSEHCDHFSWVPQAKVTAEGTTDVADLDIDAIDADTDTDTESGSVRRRQLPEVIGACHLFASTVDEEKVEDRGDGMTPVSGEKYCVDWCFEELGDGFDINRFDSITEQPSASRADCMEKCKQEELCSGYVYNASDLLQATCALKQWPATPANVTNEEPNLKGALKVACNWSPEDTEEEEDYSCLSADTEIKATGMGGQNTEVKDAAACQALCADDPACFHVVYAPKWGGCYLKSWDVKDVATKEGFFAGPRSCNGTCVDTGFAYQGDPVKSVSTAKTPQECQELCKEDGQCELFTWTQSLCALHKDKESAALLEIAADSESVCEQMCAQMGECQLYGFQDATCNMMKRSGATETGNDTDTATDTATKAELQPSDLVTISKKAALVSTYTHPALPKVVSGPAACPGRFATSAAGDAEGCPKGYFNSGSKCYRLGFEPMEWQEAEDTCEAEGGHLATVGTKEENEAVLSLFCDGDGGVCAVPMGGTLGNRYWIGLMGSNRTAAAKPSIQKDMSSQNGWVAVDGTSLEATQWGPHDVDTLKANKETDMGVYCAVFEPRDESTTEAAGLWGVESCRGTRRRYICEHDPDTNTSDLVGLADFGSGTPQTLFSSSSSLRRGEDPLVVSAGQAAGRGGDGVGFGFGGMSSGAAAVRATGMASLVASLAAAVMLMRLL
ncbi:unnamed protein product [Vitrella brassicaformis CCMP3155]|uniref:GH16 domain-containing protein n=1 Tax=Vitrella brassicaformis (strain CCMP3155) TaxID=1169540 RepID=A0A0G4ERN6_VITBC|nr:unnamed protein product [Vitrella brassicaformis CCMP3155]|eukprot:CEM00455.1 unnamed protein product [Vitrella brassicaformis CCMP3155]